MYNITNTSYEYDKYRTLICCWNSKYYKSVIISIQHVHDGIFKLILYWAWQPLVNHFPVNLYLESPFLFSPFAVLSFLRMVRISAMISKWQNDHTLQTAFEVLVVSFYHLRRTQIQKKKKHKQFVLMKQRQQHTQLIWEIKMSLINRGLWSFLYNSASSF